jgi:hypothetical protein
LFLRPIIQLFNHHSHHPSHPSHTHTHIHCRLPTPLKLPPIRYSPSQPPTDSMLQEENQTQPKPANPKQKPKQTPLMATRPNTSRKRGESEISGARERHYPRRDTCKREPYKAPESAIETTWKETIKLKKTKDIRTTFMPFIINWSYSRRSAVSGNIQNELRCQFSRRLMKLLRRRKCRPRMQSRKKHVDGSKTRPASVMHEK